MGLLPSRLAAVAVLPAASALTASHALWVMALAPKRAGLFVRCNMVAPFTVWPAPLPAPKCAVKLLKACGAIALWPGLPLGYAATGCGVAVTLATACCTRAVRPLCNGAAVLAVTLVAGAWVAGAWVAGFCCVAVLVRLAILLPLLSKPRYCGKHIAPHLP